MRLDRRLLLFGVALPVALMLVAGVVVDAMLARELLEGIDRSLRAQAAAESVSLFDGPDGTVHFHAIQSPLRAVLGNPDAAIAAYGPDGSLLARSESATAAPSSLSLTSDAPHLESREGTRVLEIAVPSPEGERYALWLSAPTDDLHGTLHAFRRTAGFALAFVTVLLVLVQRRHARWVAGRAERLAAHMHRLQSGLLDVDPPPDPVPDVLGDLRDSVADATRRLREAKRAQEHLVAGAAHELRTPLAAMRATVDVTLRRPRSESELRDALGEVREEIVKLDRRATDLLDLAAMSERTTDFERASLRDLADETARRFAAEAEERGVALEVTGADVEAEVVPDLIRRALDNLVSNALRYAPAGTAVTLEVRAQGDRTDGDRAQADRAQADRAQADRAEGDRVGVLVSDRGPGIPEGERADLFVPFHKPDRRSPGAGLGLALVSEVARIHGGTAELRESEHGASFWLGLAARASASSRAS